MGQRSKVFDGSLASESSHSGGLYGYLMLIQVILDKVIRFQTLFPLLQAADVSLFFLSPKFLI